MTQARDTIVSLGDTIRIKAGGFINDTSRKYAISCSLRATDTATNLISVNYIKSINVKFDTVGSSANNNLFHWSVDTIKVTGYYTPNTWVAIPALPAKSKLRATAVFTWSYNLPSQIGNTTATGKN